MCPLTFDFKNLLVIIIFCFQEMVNHVVDYGFSQCLSSFSIVYEEHDILELFITIDFNKISYLSYKSMYNDSIVNNNTRKLNGSTINNYCKV